MAKTEAAGTEKAEGGKKAPKKAFKKRGEKRVVHHGLAHIHASFNNTQITITDTEGNVIAWSSAGGVGFKGSRKGTPFAATQAAIAAGNVAKTLGLRSVEVRVTGPGSGRESAIEKRNFPPGQHGKTRKAKLVGYGVQLREKQKVKRIYGVLEDQFRRYFESAERQRGITGETLLQLLERRLDNVIYRLGLATSRPQARQLVRHGHFLVNGKKVDIPSYSVREGDVITVLGRSQKNVTIEHAIEEVKGRGIPEWLSFDPNALSGRIVSVPTREQINLPVQEQLIVELYSK